MILWISLIFLAGLVVFATGKVRHDVVAIAMLLAAIASGAVAPHQAFAGFADPVVTTVGAVMIISAAVARSGLLGFVLRPLEGRLSSTTSLAIAFSVICAAASSVMNNVGAVALLLPAVLDACKRAKVSPSRVLMPMSFASLLGGLITMIGTPPNILIARLREEATGAPFGMFDFAAAGLPLALGGMIVIFVCLKVLPQRVQPGGDALLFKVSDYLFEVRLPSAPKTPLSIGALRAFSADGDSLKVHALDRGGVLDTVPSDAEIVQTGDVFQLEGRAPVVQALIEKYGFEVATEQQDDRLEGALFECIVPRTSPLISAGPAAAILAEFGAALLAVSRRGRARIQAIETLSLRPNDTVLLQIAPKLLRGLIERFGLLPLAQRDLALGRQSVDWRPILCLVGAVAAAASGHVSLPIALVVGIFALAILGRLGSKAYQDVDWSVIVLLASILPVAEAFSKFGAGEQIAGFLKQVAGNQSPLAMISIALLLTLALTPLVNNAAAVLIMGPIAISAGQSVGATPEAMLMAVAIGASCDFLTPIGHQSNTLVMGPGGYSFMDYPRLGAPLTVFIIIAAPLLIHAAWS